MTIKVPIWLVIVLGTFIAVAAVVAAVSLFGSDSSQEGSNEELLASVAAELEDTLLEIGVEEGRIVAQDPFVVEVPWGNDSGCTGDGSDRDCRIVGAIGSSEGTEAAAFQEGTGGALAVLRYEYTVTLSEDECWEARNDDVEVDISPDLSSIAPTAEADANPLGDRAPDLSGCVERPGSQPESAEESKDGVDIGIESVIPDASTAPPANAEPTPSTSCPDIDDIGQFAGSTAAAREIQVDGVDCEVAAEVAQGYVAGLEAQAGPNGFIEVEGFQCGQAATPQGQRVDCHDPDGGKVVFVFGPAGP